MRQDVATCGTRTAYSHAPGRNGSLKCVRCTQARPAQSSAPLCRTAQLAKGLDSFAHRFQLLVDKRLGQLQAAAIEAGENQLVRERLEAGEPGRDVRFEKRPLALQNP